jgi:hypothetical protein
MSQGYGAQCTLIAFMHTPEMGQGGPHLLELGVLDGAVEDGIDARARGLDAHALADAVGTARPARVDLTSHEEKTQQWTVKI